MMGWVLFGVWMVAFGGLGFLIISDYNSDVEAFEVLEAEIAVCSEIVGCVRFECLAESQVNLRVAQAYKADFTNCLLAELLEAQR